MLNSGVKTIGLDVIDLDSGQRIDEVTEVIFDAVNLQVLGLLIGKIAIFKEQRIVFTPNIESVGKSAVMVKSTKAICSIDDATPRVANIINNRNFITKMLAVTKKGDNLGVISDIYFKIETGEATALEVVSNNSVKVIPAKDIVLFGKDTIIFEDVTNDNQKYEANQIAALEGFGLAAKLKNKLKNKQKPSIAELLNQINQPIRKLLKSYDPNKMNFKLKQAFSGLKKSTLKEFEKVKNKFKPKDVKPINKVQQLQIKNAIGKYATINIFTSDNKLIIPKGSLITFEIIEIAKQNNSLDNLLNNTNYHQRT